MLNAAIIGLGHWGQRLVDSVQQDGRPLTGSLHFTRAAVRSVERTRDYCNRQRLVASTFGEVLEDPAIEAIVIATPHSQHPDQVVAAARAGKHVFVEKPLALAREPAQAAIAACRDAGVILALGHNRRFLPALQSLRMLLHEEVLGRLVHADGIFAGAFGLSYSPGLWRVSETDSPAGGLSAMGIHMIDALIHLVGPIEWVSAQSLRRVLSVPMDDTTTAMIGFSNGLSGHVTTIMATAWTWQLRIYGTKGFADMASESRLSVHLRTGPSTTTRYPATDMERTELEAFAAAVAGKRPYPVSLEEVLAGVSVLEAAVQSIRSGGARTLIG